MHIKAAVLDVDGTLLDSFPIGLRSARDMFKDIGVPFKRKYERIIRDTWGDTLTNIVIALFPEATETQRRRLFALWLKYIRAREAKTPPRLFPGVNPALKTLKENMDLAVAIASNRRAYQLYEVLLTTGLKLNYVDFIIANNTSRSFAAFLKERNAKNTKPVFVGTPYKKPDKRYLTKLNQFLRKRGIMPHEVVFCGDALFDALTAKAGGYNFIPVLTGPAGSSTAWWESKLAEINVPPLAIASSIKDLPLLIQTLNRTRHDDNDEL